MKMQKESKAEQGQESKPQQSQWIIEGTGDPDIDVAALQMAVDNAPEDARKIFLKGTFSFETQTGPKQVIIKNWANISGFDDFGNKAIIQGGEIPFSVESGSQPVAIQGVHFISPRQFAIRVGKVTGLGIDRCVIEGVQMVTTTQGTDTFTTAAGIFVTETDVTGKPVGAISGKLTISNNLIDISSIAGDRTQGIVISQAPSSQNDVDIVISGNKVMNVTAFGVKLTDIHGQALVEKNEITMDPVGVNKSGFLVSGIQCKGLGVYTITGNAHISGFEKSAGIRLYNNPSSSIVDTNKVEMALSNSSIVDDRNAGIEIRGKSGKHIVSGNTISGRARAALSLIAEVNSPDSVTLQDNQHPSFQHLDADIFIGPNVTSTLIDHGTGGTIDNQGTDTKIIPDGNYN